MKKWKVILGVAAFAAVILGIILVSPKGDQAARTYGQYERNAIKNLAQTIDFSKYNPDSIIEANADNGNIPEKIRGEKDASLTIIEYADYACAHCASWHTKIEELLEKHPGKFKIVFRDFLLNFENSVIVASAANAAALQGYWEDYASLLYANQNEWYSLSGRNIQVALETYLEAVSDGQADLEKFRTDMKSEAVAKRLAFNLGLGELSDIEGTPYFRINGEKVALSNLTDIIEEKIKNL